MAIRDCDLLRLLEYKSYDLAWLTPIVFPLSIALFVQFTAWRSVLKERRNFDASAVILAGGELLVETMFGVFCFASCVANFRGRRYAGGKDHCAFQAWYAGWYTFSQLPLLATIGVAAAMKTCGERKLPGPKVCAIAVLASLGVGALIAALPFLGVGQFTFAKDYCTYDAQDTPFAVMVMLAFLLTVACVAVGHGRMLLTSAGQARIVSALAIFLFLWGWVVAAVIAFKGLISGSTCNDPFATTSPAYGLNAVFLHVQQLANPVLYAILWRRTFPSDQKAEVTPEAMKLGNELENAAGA